MAKTWILAADASRARIFELEQREKKLLEIEDFLNPEARLHEREINTDAHGRFFGGDRREGYTADDDVSAVDHTAELFAKRIGTFLDKARSQHRYQQLHLIAAPRFLGMLRRKLGKEVQKLVVEELNKDLSWFKARDLESYLNGGERPQPDKQAGNPAIGSGRGSARER
jgi:protein required for attachment to host cells